ncbi:choline/ethanolamine kinase-like [Macrosteles quadrilineatus]|uniref:choline/ethanolamine kinase-like n=1 Tax=Macrosteles quadrilineatus TaxID=74068 RepID=UPI0023E30133|nr:choline/ethanolamine kinase-like [Macrosteles quadrilineatus]XP_054280386.1 choline/ethanolamine kinase-like [Macrosteles quadrilineatus]XP_054280387.1 choline/ethanolamine kinase-like [Macrosteles quadrilineatus]
MLKLATKELVGVGMCGSSAQGPLVPTQSHVRDTAFRYCREFLPGAWRNIQYTDLLVDRVSGGLSNLLYCCQLADHVKSFEQEPRKCLIRFYGQVNRERALETLITECMILTLLSERQQGPRLYGVFPGGRLEEYIAARSLLTKELAVPAISEGIAQNLATMHLMDVPMNKSPSRMWNLMERWLETAEYLVEQGFSDNADWENMILKLQELDVRAEYNWLRNILKEVSSPVVFCHNDLQEGNILLRQSEDGSDPPLDHVTADDLVFIDYEYCSYNWRGFDMANHFLEWMYDYKNDSHPYFWARPVERHATKDQKERFVNAYLETLKNSPGYKEKPEDTVENIMKEIEFYTLASHLFWAFWSVVSNSKMFSREVEFDYWCYGERRFDGYFNQKQKLIKDYNLC